MNYRTIDLQIDFDEARGCVDERVSGINARGHGPTIEYTTPAGFHLATLTDLDRPGGEGGTRLKYRTVLLAPYAAHARRKASEIHEAVVACDQQDDL